MAKVNGKLARRNVSLIFPGVGVLVMFLAAVPMHGRRSLKHRSVEEEENSEGGNGAPV